MGGGARRAGSGHWPARGPRRLASAPSEARMGNKPAREAAALEPAGGARAALQRQRPHLARIAPRRPPTLAGAARPLGAMLFGNERLDPGPGRPATINGARRCYKDRVSRSLSPERVPIVRAGCESHKSVQHTHRALQRCWRRHGKPGERTCCTWPAPRGSQPGVIEACCQTGRSARSAGLPGPASFGRSSLRSREVSR